MKTIALTAATLLIAAGSAFAGSYHNGSANAQLAANVDNSYTTSIQKSEMPGSDRTHWGNN